SKTIFVPKPGKEKYNVAKSYRPISLSSFILKGLERIVGWYLDESVMRQNPLSRWQHGFRTEKSTETAITEVVNFIESAKLQGQFCIAILLDIQGAFDNVDASRARAALRERGFPPWFLEWYGDFLGNRYAKTEIKGEICYSNIKRGTPQGDVLSTLVWNVVYDPLLEGINNKTACKAVGFADDGIILVRGSVLDGILQESQKALDIATSWGRDNGLAFNEAKTEVLLFTNKRKFQIPWKLKMNGNSLEFAEKARYLGVTLDSKLSWGPHIEGKIKDAKRKLMMVKNAVVRLGAPPGKLLEWAYRGIIIPSLAYGASAWVNKLDSEKYIVKLRQVNRLAMLLMAKGIYRSTPTQAMEILLDFPPLDLLIKNTALLGAIRIRDLRIPWDGVGHGRQRGSLLQLTNELGTIWDQAYFLDVGKKSVDYFLNTEEENDLWKRAWKSSETIFVPQYKKLAVIRARLARGGWICSVTILASATHEIESCFTRVFNQENSELVVTFYGLQILLDHLKESDPLMEVTVMMSRAAVLVIRSPVTKNKLVQSIKNELNFVKHETKIRLRELGSRNPLKNLPWNAGAIFGGDVNGPVDPLITNKLIKVKLSDRLHIAWNERWLSYPEARQSKIWIPTAKPSKVLKLMDRQMIGFIIQIITGHGPFSYHRQFSEKEVDTTCRLCFEDEELGAHLALDCPAIARERALVALDQADMDDYLRDSTIEALQELVINTNSLYELLRHPVSS
ncbi:MAG: reverse transcriptase family protein, partial [Bacteroidota bacterium]